MKTRESGMPDEERWQSFFDPISVLESLELSPDSQQVVDMGCGYGTFSIPAAQRIAGRVYAMDIDSAMVAACQQKSEELQLTNITIHQRDFVADGTGLPDGSADYVMLFNILHAENPGNLLQEAFRILVPGGKVGVLHWNYDDSTPRGPSMAIRPRPEQCQAWLVEAGFSLTLPLVQLPPYHYGMVGRK